MQIDVISSTVLGLKITDLCTWRIKDSLNVQLNLNHTYLGLQCVDYISFDIYENEWMLHAPVYYSWQLIQIQISPTIFCAWCSLFLLLGSSYGDHNQLGHARNNITIHMFDVAEQLGHKVTPPSSCRRAAEGLAIDGIEEINIYLFPVFHFTIGSTYIYKKGW